MAFLAGNIARKLNLGYPGGPEIEKYAASGDKNRFKLPMPLIKENNSHFSFAGLKSSVANIVTENRCTEKFKRDMVNYLITLVKFPSKVEPSSDQ